MLVGSYKRQTRSSGYLSLAADQILKNHADASETFYVQKDNAECGGRGLWHNLPFRFIRHTAVDAL